MLCRVVRRSRLRAEASRALRASRGCAVSRPFSHRFVAAGHAGASMQMSRVVVIRHFDLPCWCFVAQQAKRQRFVCCQTSVFSCSCRRDERTNTQSIVSAFSFMHAFCERPLGQRFRNACPSRQSTVAITRIMGISLVVSRFGGIACACLPLL